MSHVLSLKDVSLRRGPREVLCGVDLTVDRGGVIALMGLSGSGKTTILRAIAGLEPFHAGEILVDTVRLTSGDDSRHARAELQQRVGMVFQYHFLFEHLSALQNVSLAPVHVQRTPKADAEQRAQALLDELGVGHRAGAFPRELSGGEAQRVAIARALAVDPPLLLLDEPTASLDPARREELGRTLRGLAGQGRTLLITSHDDDFVRDHVARVVILADGCVVEEGSARQVLDAPQHPATRELLQVQRAQRGAQPVTHLR